MVDNGMVFIVPHEVFIKRNEEEQEEKHNEPAIPPMDNLAVPILMHYQE